MFSSVKHGNIVSKLTNISFLNGEHDAKERKSQKQSFLSDIGGVMLVSDIWKKGITLPEVEVLINASGGKESSLIIQRRGRILGATDKKKKALFIDIIDDDSNFLSSHGENRIKALESLVESYRIKVIDVTDSNNGLKIKKYINNWFSND